MQSLKTLQFERTSYSKGVVAETKAKNFLSALGYEILNTRYKTPYGEIDIIAMKGATLHIIEVKTRPSIQQARESISKKQQERIANAAAFFLSTHQECESDVVNTQFDALFIVGTQVTFLEEAWFAESVVA
jgi:putative endonuclease